MLGILVLFNIGFLVTSFFLGREIQRTPMADRHTGIFKIEIALLAICIAGLTGSIYAVFNFI